MNDHTDELPVPAFFEHDQAIGLIVQIDREHGNIKTELADKVDVSGKILRKLLDEAIDADLIEEVPIRPGDHPRSDRYQLTERGKAVQSILRGIGLDDAHREYMARKRELEEAVADVQAIVETEGLHQKYIQQDFWSRSDFDPEGLDREDLLREPEEQEEQVPTESTRNGGRDRDEVSPDILDDESDNEDDLDPKETWGTPEEEEDNNED